MLYKVGHKMNATFNDVKLTDVVVDAVLAVGLFGDLAKVSRPAVIAATPVESFIDNLL